MNGLGGFTPDGREYVITTSRELRTPAPWVNVLANPWFGTVVSESGGAYTWCENAQTYRLTPWHNDPISDPTGEATYLRDEEDGRFWSLTPLPAGGATPYVTRHGFGYSVFEHTEGGITSELWTYVALDAPLKFVVVKVRNTSTRARRLSLTAVYELVLGNSRAANAPYIVTEIEPTTGALLARNAYNSEFSARVAFLDCSQADRSFSGDRAEIIGRNGSPAAPACLGRARLSNRLGAGVRPLLRHAGSAGARARSGTRGRLHLRLGPRHQRRADALAPFPRHGTRARGPRRRARLLDPHARRRDRRDPRPLAEFLGERMAAVPGTGGSHVGPERLLPVRGRLRIPRSAAGRHGSCVRGAVHIA